MSHSSSPDALVMQDDCLYQGPPSSAHGNGDPIKGCGDQPNLSIAGEAKSWPSLEDRDEGDEAAGEAGALEKRQMVRGQSRLPRFPSIGQNDRNQNHLQWGLVRDFIREEAITSY